MAISSPAKETRLGRVVATVSGVLLLLASGCASDPGQAGGDRTAEATGSAIDDSGPTEVEAEEGPITIGFAVSATGRFAESATMYSNGFELWADEVNGQDGIHGRPVEVLIYDDESEADTSRLMAERLIQRDEADLIIGPYGSGTTSAVIPIVEREGAPMIAALASDSTPWTERSLEWSVQGYPPASRALEGVMELFADQGVENLALVYEEGASFISNRDYVRQASEDLGIALEEYDHLPDALDFSSIVDQLARSQPDALIIANFTAPGVELVQGLMDRGVEIDAIAHVTGGDSSWTDNFGESIAGLQYGASWVPQRSPDFVAAFEDAYGTSPSYHAAAGYAAGQVAEAALAEAGTDTEALISFLQTGQVPTVLGTYDVDESGVQTGYGYIVVQRQGEDATEAAIVWTPEDGTNEDALVWPKPDWSGN